MGRAENPGGSAAMTVGEYPPLDLQASRSMAAHVGPIVLLPLIHQSRFKFPTHRLCTLIPDDALPPIIRTSSVSVREAENGAVRRSHDPNLTSDETASTSTDR